MFATSCYCENLLVGFFVISATDKWFFFGGFWLKSCLYSLILKWGLCCWICANCCCSSNLSIEFPTVSFIFPNGQTFKPVAFLGITSKVMLQFWCCKNQLFHNFFMACWLLYPSSSSCQKQKPIVEQGIHALEFM